MTQSERVGKKIIWVLDGVVNAIVMIILLLLLAFGGYAFYDSQALYDEAARAQYEIYKPSNDEELPTFDDLVKINPEVMAWLTVNATGIDYPVTQTTNNEKYINTDALGKYSMTGSLFLDYQNNKHFKDFNSIIYGHHMDKDTMFGDLDKFRKKKFFDSHKYGNLFYDGKDHGLEFFAFIEADAYDMYLYNVGIEGKAKQQNYLNYILKKAKYTRDFGQTTKDHIVLLSTCSADQTNGRYILVGRLSKNIYPYDSQKDKEDSSLLGIDGKDPLGWLMSLPLWAWILIIFWIILLILLIMRLIDRKKKRDKDKNENE